MESTPDAPTAATRARRAARELRPWFVAWLAVSALAALAGWVLPWHLDDRLRCVAAYEATVGPLDEAADALGPFASATVGRDPWGRPFLLARSAYAQCSSTGRASVVYTRSTGPDGVVGGRDDVELPPGGANLAVLSARAAPWLALKLVTLLLFAAWCIWRWSPRWPRLTLVVAPLAAAFLASMVGTFLSFGFDVAPPTTPLGGPVTLVASAWFAGLVATLLLVQARARRDEARS